MALSDLFPYGAPELVEGAPARMARSTLMASLAVSFLVVATGTMRPQTVMPAIEACLGCGYPPPLLDPHIIPDPPSGSPVPRTKVAADPHALPKLVPDPFATDMDFDTPVLSDGPVGDESVTPSRGGPDVASVLPTRDPYPGEYVAVDEMPAQVSCAEPRYPDLARSAGVEGTVRVLMLVGLHGRVERAILAPNGSIPMLDQAALEAALTCVFTPALSNGHPVKVWVSQSYRFRLH